MEPDELFWKLAADLQAEDPRIVEGTIMNGRCLRVGKEFLALVDSKGSGLVVKLPKARVTEADCAGCGRGVCARRKSLQRVGLGPRAQSATLASTSTRRRSPCREALILRTVFVDPNARDVGDQSDRVYTSSGFPLGSRKKTA